MNILSKIGKGSFLLIPLALCFWERGNTGMLLLYGVTVLLQPGLFRRFGQALRCRWVIPFLALYGLTALSLFWSSDLSRAAYILEKKAALAVLPLLVAMDGQLSRRLIRAAMLSLVSGCVLAIWVALGNALWQYGWHGDVSVFFYHRLGEVLDGFNGVYFSFYTFISIAFLDYLIREKAFRALHSGWWAGVALGTLLTGIVLLSSRLFIFLALCYGIYWLAGKGRAWFSAAGFGRNWTLLALFVVFGGMAFFANRGRFQELTAPHLEVLRQGRFQWDTSFDGVSLRLLLLKLGWQALVEEQALVEGLGAGDVQQAMNSLMLRYNLYHGNPELGDTGYLNYSLHNQYMETWLQAGLPALAVWIWLLAFGWREALNSGWAFPLFWLVLAIMAFSCFESVLERHRGVVFIAFYLSILYSNKIYEDTEVAYAGIDGRVE